MFLLSSLPLTSSSSKIAKPLEPSAASSAIRCGMRNQGNLHYFNIEGDGGHRIGTCDECGNYIRTRFAGEGDNAPYSPEVEDVVMARLDAVAMDPSFAGGSAKRTGE